MLFRSSFLFFSFFFSFLYYYYYYYYYYYLTYIFFFFFSFSSSSSSSFFFFFLFFSFFFSFSFFLFLPVAFFGRNRGPKGPRSLNRPFKAAPCPTVAGGKGQLPSNSEGHSRRSVLAVGAGKSRKGTGENRGFLFQQIRRHPSPAIVPTGTGKKGKKRGRGRRSYHNLR